MVEPTEFVPLNLQFVDGLSCQAQLLLDPGVGDRGVEGPTEGRPVLGDDPEEDLDDHRVKVSPAERLDVVDHPVDRPRRPIGPIRPEGVPDVDRCEEAGRQGDLLPFETARIAGAVPLLMVGVGDLQRRAEETDRREPLLGVFRVPPHDRPFLVVQRSGFEEDGVGDAHLADVMEQGAAADVGQVRPPIPSAWATFTDSSVTRRVCPSVSLSRRSRARDQPSIVAS